MKIDENLFVRLVKNSGEVARNKGNLIIRMDHADVKGQLGSVFKVSYFTPSMTNSPSVSPFLTGC
jgi:hypothetical protein